MANIELSKSTPWDSETFDRVPADLFDDSFWDDGDFTRKDAFIDLYHLAYDDYPGRSKIIYPREIPMQIFPGEVAYSLINDAPMKLLRLKEVKELKVDNKVLIRSGKWKIESESIKPYEVTFIDLEEVNTLDRPINKTRLTQVCCAMIIIFGLYTYLTFDNSSGGFSLDFNYNNADN